MLNRLVLLFMFCLCIFTGSAYGQYSACAGSTKTKPPCADAFVIAYPGGIWTVSPTDPEITIDPITGELAIGNYVGTITVTYTKTDACGTHVFSYTLTVNALPADIDGPSTVCVGETITLTSTPSGGTWSSSAPGIASVGASTGIVTGVTAGTAVISYTLSTGCYKTKLVTVTDARIEGPNVICLSSGAAVTLSGTPGSGTWTSSNTGVATIGYTTGIVTRIAAGTTIITYTAPSGCMDTMLFTVGAPLDPISICEISPIYTCEDTVAACDTLKFIVKGAPAGATYTWSPTSPNVTTVTDTGVIFTFYSITTSATYTVTGCYNGCCTTAKVYIFVTAGCPPCSSFRPCSSGCEGPAPAFKTILGNTLTSVNVSTTVAQNYFIGNASATPSAPNTEHAYTMTVSPAAGSIFLMDNNVKLIVPTSASVLLDSCHFFAAQGCKWGGITVLADNTAAGKITLENNTLMEHVKSVNSATADDGAITVKSSANPNGSIPAGFTGSIIRSDGAIFNQNFRGITIMGFLNATTLPFVVKKTVFTSRDFCKYHIADPSSCKDYYPFVWPNANDLRVQTGAASEYNPGFNNIDSFPGVLNIGGNQKSGAVGLYLTKVGNTVSGTSPTYSSLVIGDPDTANNTNLFDTLLSGIWAQETNLFLYNNVFRRSQSTTYGRGVYFAQNNNSTFRLDNGSVDNTNNRFYNCNQGIECISCYDFRSYRSVFKSSNYWSTSSSISSRGDYGIKIDNTPSVTVPNLPWQEVKDDTFANVNRSIYVSTGSASPCSNNTVTIWRNVITGITGGSTIEYAGDGITFNDASLCTSNAGVVNIWSNYIYGHIKGIYVVNRRLATHVDSNYVELRDSYPRRSTFPDLQKGIYITTTTSANALVATVNYNEVAGNTSHSISYNTPAPNLTSSLWYSGIEFLKSGSASTTTTVSCNYVHDLPIGFSFLNQNYLLWKNNVMSRAQYGMALQKFSGTFARIGDQGTACNPSDNLWADGGAPTTWPGWTGSTNNTWHTLTYMEDPASNTSNLYVRNVAGYMPNKNTTAGTGGVAYTLGTSLLSSSDSCGTALSEPEVCAPGGSYSRPVMPGGGIFTDQGVTRESQYAIAPNPSNGDIVISQTIASDLAAGVTVMNYAGATIYRGKLQFTNGKSNLKIGDVAPGLYMVRITDGNGVSHTFKLQIQK